MILLDSHVVLWLLTRPSQLTEKARARVLGGQRGNERIVCSAASLYEISYATRRKRIPLLAGEDEFIEAVQREFEWLPMTAEIALHAANIPAPFHGDPMDRLIVATAIVENCTLITADERILSSGACKTLW